MVTPWRFGRRGSFVSSMFKAAGTTTHLNNLKYASKEPVALNELDEYCLASSKRICVLKHKRRDILGPSHACCRFETACVQLGFFTPTLVSQIWT